MTAAILSCRRGREGENQKKERQKMTAVALIYCRIRYIDVVGKEKDASTAKEPRSKKRSENSSDKRLPQMGAKEPQRMPKNTPTIFRPLIMQKKSRMRRKGPPRKRQRTTTCRRGGREKENRKRNGGGNNATQGSKRREVHHLRRLRSIRSRQKSIVREKCCHRHPPRAPDMQGNARQRHGQQQPLSRLNR